METFEWLHVWSEPRISILYDSHIDESWSDTSRLLFVVKKCYSEVSLEKIAKKKSPFQ